MKTKSGWVILRRKETVEYFKNVPLYFVSESEGYYEHHFDEFNSICIPESDFYDTKQEALELYLGQIIQADKVVTLLKHKIMNELVEEIEKNG